MNATRSLPEAYQEVGTIDLKKNQRLLVILNVAGLFLLILAGWLALQALFWLRPTAAPRVLSIQVGTFWEWLQFAGGILLLSIFFITVHEAVHGIFFWIYTRTRPVFAFRWTYAYASAPGWYLRRNPFFITTLAPLVLISLVGVALMAIVPAGWLLAIWFVVTMNAGGAVGDVLVAAWLLRQPVTCLAQDHGDAVTLYCPESPKNAKNSLV